MMGISAVKLEWIISFKAKAWIDLRDKLEAASADVKKHRNDIIRIVSELPLKNCALPEKVRSDMKAFVEEFDVTETELKNLKIRGTKPAEIKEILREIYLID